MNRVKRKGMVSFANYKRMDKIKKINIGIITIALLPLVFFKKIGLTSILNILFFLIIFIILLGTIYYINKKLNSNYIEVINFVKIIKEEPLEDEKIENFDVLKRLWNSYHSNFFKGKESIVSTEYFNDDTLIYSFINMKWLNYVSNLFISVGILGTFLGLALGLSGLNGLGNILSIDQLILSEMLANLLTNVSTSFYTSLYGIFYSILYYIFYTLYMNEFENNISNLNLLLFLNFSSNNEINKLEEIDNNILAMNNNLSNKILNLKMELNNSMHSLNDKTLEKMSENNRKIITKLDLEMLENKNKFNTMMSYIENAEKEFKNIMNIQNNKLLDKLNNNRIENDNKLNELINQVDSFGSKFNNGVIEFRETIKLIGDISNYIKEKFEKTLLETLNKIFNDKYVTEMNMIQNQFIENSRELNNVSEENVKTLTELRILSKQLTVFNEDLKYISDKFYNKETLQNILDTINESMLTSKETIVETNEYFKDEVVLITDSLKEFRKNIKNIDYNPLIKSLEKTELIIKENQNMIDKYSNFYNNISNEKIEVEEMIKLLKDKIGRMNVEVDLNAKMSEFILSKDQNIKNNILAVMENAKLELHLINREIINNTDIFEKTRNKISGIYEELNATFESRMNELNNRIHDSNHILNEIIAISNENIEEKNKELNVTFDNRMNELNDRIDDSNRLLNEVITISDKTLEEKNEILDLIKKLNIEVAEKYKLSVDTKAIETKIETLYKEIENQKEMLIIKDNLNNIKTFINNATEFLKEKEDEK